MGGIFVPQQEKVSSRRRSRISSGGQRCCFISWIVLKYLTKGALQVIFIYRMKKIKRPREMESETACIIYRKIPLTVDQGLHALDITKQRWWWW